MTAAQRQALKKYITIPDYLIYEVIDNIPVYYRNYIDVLNKEKTLDDRITDDKFCIAFNKSEVNIDAANTFFKNTGAEEVNSKSL